MLFRFLQGLAVGAKAAPRQDRRSEGEADTADYLYKIGAARGRVDVHATENDGHARARKSKQHEQAYQTL